MRKVFWCSLAGGIMLTGGVFTVGFFAARHPQSLTGRVVLSAGQTALSMNPLTVYSSTLAQLEKVRKGQPADEQPVAEQAAGGEEQAEPAGPAEVAEGVIRIPENEPVGAEPVFDHLVLAPRSAEAVECPAAPVAMPFCTDDEGTEATQVNACAGERLPMPSVEVDEEEQEEAQQGAGAIDRLFRLFEHATHKAVEGTIDPVEPVAPAAAPVSKTPECREDPNAYQHHSGCPAMGGHCIVPRSVQPAKSLPPVPAGKTGGEESGERLEGDGHSSALRAIRRFSMRGVEDRVPAHPEVDTMEYRISDGQLYDLGPGGL